MKSEISFTNISFLFFFFQETSVVLRSPSHPLIFNFLAAIHVAFLHDFNVFSFSDILQMKRGSVVRCLSRDDAVCCSSEVSDVALLHLFFLQLSC